MKFIADAMLGRLARWLRLLGFDTLYYNDISDRELLKIALREDRFILTRDTDFLEMKIRNCLMIQSDQIENQISQVLRDLNISVPTRGRCPNCNGFIEDIARKEDVRDLLPEYVYLTHSHFQRCTDCGNLYWEGTHYQRLREKLKNMLRSAQRGQN